MDFKLMSTALTSEASLMVPELEGLPRGHYPKGGAGEKAGKAKSLTQDQLQK